MKRFNVHLDDAPRELIPGLKILASTAPLDFETSLPVQIKFSQGETLSVQRDDDVFSIEYGQINDAFRAIGLITARHATWPAAGIVERRRLEKLHVMLDASRNAVLNMKSAKQWLRFLALAGVNGFMFYTEDTFEVPGEDLFGYMRGKLTIDELTELDEFAAALGVEMIPCVQTLAHMQRLLQYPKYGEIQDTTSVMLCDEPKTYEFIEKILAAAVKPYRSKRVHIGMDEAWDLGRGAYLNRHGLVPPFKIMSDHLKKVLEITKKMGLEPMMWSDMFFRSLSPKHSYDPDVEITPEVKAGIPSGADLIYWDYYRSEDEFYEKLIDKHAEMNGAVPIVATGIWAWNRFWTDFAKTERNMSSAMRASLGKGVKDMIITIWGDDGTECDYFSTFPLIQYASDMNFTGAFDLQDTKINLGGAYGIDYDEWRQAAELQAPPCPDSREQMSKMLLWEDPLLGLAQPLLQGTRLNGFYKKLAASLEKTSKKKRNRRLRLPYYLAAVLADKADLPTLLLEAYRANDRKKLEKIADRLPKLIQKIKRLNEYHRKLWLKNHKAFGWEVLERRYGGLIGVMENLRFRLGAYLDGDIDTIEELEVERIAIPCGGSSWRVMSAGQYFHTMV